MSTYYNTNGIDEELLAKYRAKNNKQERLIYEMFLERPDSYLTSHDVEDLMAGRYPRTSVIRACNTLMNDGLILKTDHMVIGKYGKQCHTYILAKKREEQQTLF